MKGKTTSHDNSSLRAKVAKSFEADWRRAWFKLHARTTWYVGCVVFHV